MPTYAHQKKIEAYILSSARKAGVPIPIGEKPGIEPAPDFVFDHEHLGIELTELLRPADDGCFMPAAQESFHSKLIPMAQAEYYSVNGAKPAQVVTYFSNRAGKQDMILMARSLAEFVRTNISGANPIVGFPPMETPEGFGALSITAETADWWGGESGGTTLSEIPNQLAHRIREKDKRLAAYRKSLPQGARVWLLIYSLGTVSRNMPIAHGTEQCQFLFGFERVFWFDSLENRFAEIQREPVAT